MRKSLSTSDLDETSSEFIYEDFFEGDGPLGIVFVEIQGETVIKSIMKGTVASEYYNLKTEMILVGIGTNGDVSSFSHKKRMNMIEKEWREKSLVYLKFRTKIHTEVLQILNEHSLIKYYDSFIDLGAKSKGDFEYIEYDDLIKMGFSRDEIEMFKKINPNI